MSFTHRNYEVRDGQWISWEAPRDQFMANPPGLGDQSPEDGLLEQMALLLREEQFVKAEGVLLAVRFLRPDLAPTFDADAARLAEEWKARS